jgi:hypothetical protein
VVAVVEEARVLVAHLFQRAGREVLSESEMANAMSLDLGWYPPREARDLVAGFVRAALLEHTEDGDLRPLFPAREVKVPLGFRPQPGLVRALPPPGQFQAANRAEAAVTAPVAAPEQPTAPAPAVAQAAGRIAVQTADEAELTLPALLARFADAAQEDVGTWVARMERVVQASGDLLSPEVALLLAAARHGNDVRDLARVVRERMETGS